MSWRWRRVRLVWVVVALVVAYLFAQGLNVWTVTQQGGRVDRLIEAQKLESIADCVENRANARDDRRQQLGILVLAAGADDVSQIRADALAELREPQPSAETLYRTDVRSCEALAERLHHIKFDPAVPLNP